MAFIDLDESRFQAQLDALRQPALLVFHAPYCGPSASMEEAYGNAVEEFGDRIAFCDVNIEKQPSLAMAFKVKALPTFVMVVKGQPIASRLGTMPEQTLRDFIAAFAI